MIMFGKKNMEKMEDDVDMRLESYPEIAEKLIGVLQPQIWYLDGQTMAKREGQNEAHYHALRNTRKLIWEALVWQYPYDPKKTHIVFDGVGHSHQV